MESDSYNKTAARQSDDQVSCGDDGSKIVEKGPAAEVEQAYVAADQPEPSKIGRPRGARNKRNDALRKLQEDRYGVTVGELLTETLFDGYAEHKAAGHSAGSFLERRAIGMAIRTGIPIEKCMAHVKAMADDLMPYVHQKLPLAVEVDTKGIAIAVFTPDGGFASHTQGPLDLRPAQARGLPDTSINDKDEPKSDGNSRTNDE
ncbi:MAG: hypothetical protein AAFY82_00165 [Pseudomonadota bacterium]